MDGLDPSPDDAHDGARDAAWWRQFAAGVTGALALDALTVLVAWSAPVVATLVAPSSQIGNLAMVVTYGWTLSFGVLQLVYIGPLAGALWTFDKKSLATGVVAGAGFALIGSGLLYGCVLTGIGGIAAYCSTVHLSF